MVKLGEYRSIDFGQDLRGRARGGITLLTILCFHLLALRSPRRGRSESKTVSGGEFGWGGTSVKR